MKAVLPKNRLESNGALPSTAVTIPKLQIRTLEVRIQSKSGLIVHAWSEKAMRMMLDKQTGEPSAGRAKKDPLADFKGSLYVLPKGQGFGVPAPAFKAAIVSAANDVEMKMTEVKRGMHVNDYYVKIESDPLDKDLWTEWDHKYEAKLKFEHEQGCSMRSDMVRLETGVADIRFRGWWPKWKATLEIEFNESVLTAAEVVNLVSAAGYGCGICENRPSAPKCRSGEFGRFSVCED